MAGYAKTRIQQTTCQLPESDVPWAIDDMTLAGQLGIRNAILWWAIINKDKLYRVYRIAKRTPGTGSRQIQEPDRRLKYIQKVLLERFLQRLFLGEHVGAYVLGRSIVHTARQHVKKAVIVSLDLQDFFPSVKRSMIRNFLQQDVGYDRKIADFMAALMTYKNFVPQGAPTSGTIANLIADKLMDQPILEKLRGTPWRYTRYSDDIDISSVQDQSEDEINRIIKIVTRAAQHAGFKVKESKTKIMRHDRRQKVLGLIVNDKVSIDSHRFKALRKLIRACKIQGFEKQLPALPDGKPDIAGSRRLCTYIAGTLAYFHQVEPEKTNKLKQEFEIAIQNSTGFIHTGQHAGDPCVGETPTLAHRS